jgi:hypothetical protein
MAKPPLLMSIISERLAESGVTMAKASASILCRRYLRRSSLRRSSFISYSPCIGLILTHRSIGTQGIYLGVAVGEMSKALI